MLSYINTDRGKFLTSLFKELAISKSNFLSFFPLNINQMVALHQLVERFKNQPVDSSTFKLPDFDGDETQGKSDPLAIQRILDFGANEPILLRIKNFSRVILSLCNASHFLCSDLYLYWNDFNFDLLGISDHSEEDSLRLIARDDATRQKLKPPRIQLTHFCMYPSTSLHYQAKQIWERKFWVFRTQQTSSNVRLIVPNSTASFVLFEGVVSPTSFSL